MPVVKLFIPSEQNEEPDVYRVTVNGTVKEEDFKKIKAKIESLTDLSHQCFSIFWNGELFYMQFTTYMVILP